MFVKHLILGKFVGVFRGVDYVQVVYYVLVINRWFRLVSLHLV